METEWKSVGKTFAEKPGSYGMGQSEQTKTLYTQDRPDGCTTRLLYISTTIAKNAGKLPLHCWPSDSKHTQHPVSSLPIS